VDAFFENTVIFRKPTMSKTDSNTNTIANASGLDKNAIREAAHNIKDGAVTAGYQGDRHAVISMLNIALATELVCVLRYKRHFHTAAGIQNESIKAEFLQHAHDEERHADRLAERIVQLNGEPDFNPAHLTQASHAEYDESCDIMEMIKSNLIAERIAIESYRQMIKALGEDDPTTRQILIDIMMTEEQHADDMRDMLV